MGKKKYLHFLFMTILFLLLWHMHSQYFLLNSTCLIICFTTIFLIEVPISITYDVASSIATCFSIRQNFNGVLILHNTAFGLLLMYIFAKPFLI
jgi:hypothetical protein